MVSKCSIRESQTQLMEDYEDVERYRPGAITAFKEWWTVSVITASSGACLEAERSGQLTNGSITK